MPDYIERSNITMSNEPECKMTQNKCNELKENDFQHHQLLRQSQNHQFLFLKPIRSFHIYLNQTAFCVALNGLNPMSLVQCNNCGLKFISVMESGGIKLERPKTSFDCTLAALYNTSQLIRKANVDPL